MSKPPVSSVVSDTETSEGSTSDGSVLRRFVADRINSVRPIVLWIAPLLLATLVPGLAWGSLERPMATQIALVAAMSVGVGLVAVALVAALSWGFTRRVRWALGVATAATVVLFGWPAFTDAGVQVAAAFRLSVLSDAIPVLLAVTFLWLAVRRAGETLFTIVLGVGVLALVVAAVIGLPSPTESAANNPGVPAPANSPDVVLLILDGYAGDDTLQETYGFDNTSFLAEIAELGFEVAPAARANYGLTYAAVSTMLNLDYVFDIGEITEPDLAAMREALSGDPALYRLFHEAGYEVAFAENAWSGSYCGRAVDVCWRDGLAERALWSLGRMTIFAPLQSEVQPDPFNTVSYDHLSQLPEIVRHDRTDGVPRLTVAHVILPHPPLVLDSRCNRGPDIARHPLRNTDPAAIELRRSHYVDQVMCTNATVIQVLREIITERSDVVVMMTADHGLELSRPAGPSVTTWTDGELETRMEILSAYRFSGCEQNVPPAITPVNGIRLTANCALDAGLDALPDLNYWAPAGIRGEVTDIGPRLEN